MKYIKIFLQRLSLQYHRASWAEKTYAISILYKAKRILYIPIRDADKVCGNEVKRIKQFILK